MQNTIGLAKVFLHIATLYLKRSVSHENCLCAVSSGCVGGCRSWSSCPAAGECWSGLSLATGPHWHWTQIGDHGPAPHHDHPPRAQSSRGRTTGYTHSMLATLTWCAKLTDLTASNKSSKVSLKKAIQSYPSQMSKIHFRSAQFPRMKI